jgi:hypothetical protein
MSLPGASQAVHAAATDWEGVTAHPHRFGGTEFRLGRREIGHIHGDYLVDIPFPKRIRDEVLAEGYAQLHHILPDSGWVSCYLRQPDDLPKVIQLLQHSYNLALQQRHNRESTPGQTA